MSQAHRAPGWKKLRAQAVAIHRANQTPCCFCGRPIDYDAPSNARHGLTIDHPQQLQMGGDLLPGLEQLQPAHRSCNSRAGAQVGNAIKYRDKPRRGRPRPMRWELD